MGLSQRSNANLDTPGSPSTRAWRIALIGTLLVAVIAEALTYWATGNFAWGPPEMPKAQGEALEQSSAFSPGSMHYKSSVTVSVIREPENTWSNLAFVFAGVLIAAHDRRLFDRLFGAALFSLGVASSLYHASLLPSLRTFDVAMMGWVVFSLGCLGWRALGRSWVGKGTRILESSTVQLTVGLTGATLAIATAIIRNDVRIAGIKPFDSTYVTVTGIGVILLLLVVGIKLGAKKSLAGRIPFIRITGLILVVGTAILCQVGDHPGQWFFRPNGLLQAHAVWHVLMALAALQCYDLFARLEGREELFAKSTV